MIIRNIEPWLEYFRLLNTQFVKNGMLEVFPASGEAYITYPALCFLAGVDIQKDDKVTSAAKIARTAIQLRTYAEYLNAANEGYKQYLEQYELANDTPATNTNVEQAAENTMKMPKGKSYVSNIGRINTFALHIVDDTLPHNLRNTVLLTRRRRWWFPFVIATVFDLIEYKQQE